jgi:hypothetical protein
MIFRCFQLPLLLLASRLFLHSTRAAFILYCLYTWESSRFLAWWHFYLLKLQCILTDISFFIIANYDVVRLIVGDGAVSFHLLIPLSYLHDFFLLNLVYAYTSVFLSNFTPIQKHVVGLKSSWVFSLLCPFMYCSFAYLLLSLLSPLCRVFTIVYLKQTLSIGYRLLQLFCTYNLWYT